MARDAMRKAVVGELRNAELLLANIVVGYAWGPTGVGVDRAIKETRWLIAPEQARVEGVGFFEATGEMESRLEGFRDRSDQEIAMLMRMAPSTAKRRPLEVHLPVLEAMLRQPQAGFTDRQIQLLASVRWQLQLLNDGAQWTHRFFRMTFTVKNPDNHQAVVANHESCRQEHRHRAGLALEARSAAPSASSSPEGERGGGANDLRGTYGVEPDGTGINGHSHLPGSHATTRVWWRFAPIGCNRERPGKYLVIDRSPVQVRAPAPVIPASCTAWKLLPPASGTGFALSASTWRLSPRGIQWI